MWSNGSCVAIPRHLLSFLFMFVMFYSFSCFNTMNNNNWNNDGSWKILHDNVSSYNRCLRYWDAYSILYDFYFQITSRHMSLFLHFSPLHFCVHLQFVIFYTPAFSLCLIFLFLHFQSPLKKQVSIKHCSLSIVLTVTDQKLQKTWYSQHYIYIYVIW